MADGETQLSGVLEEMTIEQVRALAPTVAVIPCGSTEPHGPALPYSTDSNTVSGISQLATRLANRQGGRVLCYPTLPITLNNNFRDLPFACRVSVPTFMAMLGDIIEQAGRDGIRRVVVLNGHGGNTDAIRATLRHLSARDDLPFVCAINGWGMADEAVRRANVEMPSEHGGEAEASLQMHLKGHLVHHDKLADNPIGALTLDSLRDPRVYLVRRWSDYMPASAGGDQRRASAAKGKAIIESAAATVARLLLELSTAPETANFPF